MTWTRFTAPSDMDYTDQQRQPQPDDVQCSRCQQVFTAHLGCPSQAICSACWAEAIRNQLVKAEADRRKAAGGA